MKKFLLALVIVFSVPVSSYAISDSTPVKSFDFSSYSLNDLRSFVVQAQKRIKELEVSEEKKCFISNSALSLGDGEFGVLSSDVKKLQDFLREKGYLQYKSTGYFGKMTQSALTQFQSNQGLNASGQFDENTRMKIHGTPCMGFDKKIEVDYKKIPEQEKKPMPKTEVSSLKSIELMSLGYGKVIWKTDGYSKDGFKLVYSKNQNPVYPPRESDKAAYYEAGNSYGYIEAKEGTGIYYVRVCEYTGSGCGIYSNEIKIEL